MGIEWINKSHKTFAKSMAKGRSYLLTPRLGETNVGEVERSFLVQMEPNRSVQPGTQVVLRADDKSVNLLDGNEQVIGRAEQPPPWVAELVKNQAEGVALGIIDGVNDLAQTADVRLQIGNAQS